MKPGERLTTLMQQTRLHVSFQNIFSTLHRYKSTTENRVGVVNQCSQPQHSTADVLNGRVGVCFSLISIHDAYID